MKLFLKILIFLIISTPICAAEIRVSGNIVKFDGDIEVGDELVLERLMQLPSDVSILELKSRGGDVYTAMQIASKIRGAEIVTRAVGDCLSACTVIFIGGKTRELGESGVIGFHRVQDAQTGEYLAFEDPLYNRLTMLTWRLGVDPMLFIQWMNIGTIDELFYPSQEELCDASVVTEC